MIIETIGDQVLITHKEIALSVPLPDLKFIHKPNECFKSDDLLIVISSIPILTLHEVEMKDIISDVVIEC